jgi:hypothetical protein
VGTRDETKSTARRAHQRPLLGDQRGLVHTSTIARNEQTTATRALTTEAHLAVGLPLEQQVDEMAHCGAEPVFRML